MLCNWICSLGLVCGGGQDIGAPSNASPQGINFAESTAPRVTEESPAAAEEEEGPWRALPDPILGFNVSGWVYGTANYSFTNAGKTRYNGPLTMNDQEGGYLNQLWVNINKPLGDELGWGANVDAFYG